MLVAVWGLLTALVLAHMPVGRPSLRSAGRSPARAALLGAPLMVALFVLFPRIGPLWGAAAGRGRQHRAVRVACAWAAWPRWPRTTASRCACASTAPAPPPERDVLPRPGAVQLRRPRVDAAGRRRSPVALRHAAATSQVLGRPLRYEMTLEPSRLAMLPLLEMTPDRARRRAAARRLAADAAPRPAVADRPAGRPTGCASRPPPGRSTATARGAEAPALRDLVALPPGYNPRTLALGRQAARARPDAAGRAHAGHRAAAPHRAAAATPTRWSPASTASDTIDEFWFDRKLGFCEHFATAFVVVMRALDVPARIVTGYQGADPSRWTATGSCARAMPTPGPSSGRPGAAGCASTRPPRSRPTASARPAACAPRRGSSPARSARVRPAAAGAPARGLGGAEQPLEPVGAELLAQPAVRPARRTWASKSPSWQDLAYAADRPAVRAQPGRRRLGLWDRRRQDPWQRLQQRMRSGSTSCRCRCCRTTRRARVRRRCARRSARAARQWLRCSTPRRRALCAGRTPAHRARLVAALQPRRGAGRAGAGIIRACVRGGGGC